MALFSDRFNAGKILAENLMDYQSQSDVVVVLALPRGGVPVAYQVARALNAPLDILLVRKLGVPEREELAMGAIASGGICVLNEDVIQTLHIPRQIIDQVVEAEKRELERRERLYRGDRPPIPLAGKTVILVDDGLATGASMRAAVDAVRMQQPAKIVVAVPTAAPEICLQFQAHVDQIICATTPQPFYGVGMWYEDFAQTSDEEVRRLLKDADRALHAGQQN